MPNDAIENPEDKDLQDHTFGKKIAEMTEQAERQGEGAGEGAAAADSKETEHHAGGKA